MLPPFFKTTCRRAGNGLWVYTDWKDARHAAEYSTDRIVAMVDEDPRLYDWPIQDMEVLCMAHDDTLVQVLIEHGASIVRTVDDEGELRVYKCR